ncbi:hypothetical protein GCM10010402_50830 [Actinomadura luteofluorescens]|uniref:hypothetical protein n=1 Tax=Actinomadura luteofluorescens TaxID=46163 RepID=UPI0021640BEB|nr:hypothetical protein [Actinomadura glauciflava]MCR3745813.1 hypothetical protein [Actinomadura glauciflava]
MGDLLSRRIGASAAVLALGAAMAAGGQTAASAATPGRHTTSAVAGTGACTTGMFCLWGKPNYDPPLVARIYPVTHGHSDVGSIGAVSGYNATNQGQILWQRLSGCINGTGPRVYIPPFTHFSDIRPKLGWRGGFCVTHS